MQKKAKGRESSRAKWLRGGQGSRDSRSTTRVRSRAVLGAQGQVGHNPASVELEVMLGRGRHRGSFSCSETHLCHCRLRTALLPPSQHPGSRQWHRTRGRADSLPPWLPSNRATVAISHVPPWRPPATQECALWTDSPTASTLPDRQT